MPRICDYEGSQYRTEFWENQNRAYEDAVERIAMQHMLPPRGDLLIEVGAGFGRLVDLYRGYDQIVLMDYARSQLQEAQKYLGNDGQIIYVVADVYTMPFVDNLFSTLTAIRVMHHLVDVPAALAEIHRIMAANGTAIIEHANKFNLKAVLRWLVGKQQWNPFDPEPVEFVDLNFNFHPAWMRQRLADAGFTVQNIRTLSHYRIDLLKRWLPTSLLVSLDSLAQPTGNWWQLAPSIFLQAQASKPNAPSATNFFCCPRCKSPRLSKSKTASLQRYLLICQACDTAWSYEDGIYDFKTPAEKAIFDK